MTNLWVEFKLGKNSRMSSKSIGKSKQVLIDVKILMTIQHTLSHQIKLMLQFPEVNINKCIVFFLSFSLTNFHFFVRFSLLIAQLCSFMFSLPWWLLFWFIICQTLVLRIRPLIGRKYLVFYYRSISSKFVLFYFISVLFLCFYLPTIPTHRNR